MHAEMALASFYNALQAALSDADWPLSTTFPGPWSGQGQQLAEARPLYRHCHRHQLALCHQQHWAVCRFLIGPYEAPVGPSSCHITPAIFTQCRFETLHSQLMVGSADWQFLV